jgi:hypothetical protein
VIEPGVAAAVSVSIVEEVPRHIDDADAFEADVEHVLVAACAGGDADHGSGHPVSDVPLWLPGGVKPARRSPGGDAVADREGPAARSVDDVGPEFAVCLEESAGETVELPAPVVGPFDERMGASGLVIAPPAIEQLGVKGGIVRGVVQVPGVVEDTEGISDAAFPEVVGGGAVCGVLEPA